MKYASETSVSVSKSRAEIEDTVSRYGATGFMSGWKDNRAMIGFEMRGRQIRFTLPLPDKNAKEFTTGARGRSFPTEFRRSPEESEKRWEQACRQRWRALALAIKAKLEAVESEIGTFDSEFMAQIVLPSGLTIGETILPDMPRIMSGAPLPPLLPNYTGN